MVVLRASRAHQEGRTRRHDRGARDAMDALAPPDERRQARTAKSCGLDASTLALTRQECFRIPPGMVARKPDHQREHEAAVKTNRAGKAGSLRRTCGD